MCSSVSPLWFLFTIAGLPEVGRPTDVLGVEGDFWTTVRGPEGLSLCSSLDFLILLPHLGLNEDGGLRVAGDNCDFLLLPGEALGLFGVVSSVVTFSSSLHLFEECLEGEALSCFSGLWIELGACEDGVSCCMTLSDMLWPGCVWSFGRVLSSETFSLMVFLPGRMAEVFLRRPSSWGSSDVTTGLRKETLLLDLPALSAQDCSFSFPGSTSTVMPHCWFMAPSLLFFIASSVFFRVALVAPCEDIFLLPAFLLVETFFLLLFSFLHIWEGEEAESWEEEVKLKTERSPGWAESMSGCAAVVSSVGPLSGAGPSDGFSTMQRTLRLRGLNHILKFFLCFKTELSGCAWITAGEQSAVRCKRKIWLGKIFHRTKQIPSRYLNYQAVIKRAL